ncbi:hypothetical protein [Demequina silvatica]|uniref:hypothetical protein n=1 Tax=Demequina silvatica TaxID=1638988 RepID=UPI000784E03B|nr:hypothetical protein [Demequina silvatica]
MTSAANVEALERASGRDWAGWVAVFEAAGGPSLGHRELVAVAYRDLGHVDNPGWWAQMTAVAYEQHIGRRAPGQRQDGSYECSVSRTHGGTLDQALGAWLEVAAGLSGVGGVPFAGSATSTATPAYRRWRAALSDGSRLLAEVSLRADRAVVTLTWSRLPSPEAKDEARPVLKALLASL